MSSADHESSKPASDGKKRRKRKQKLRKLYSQVREDMQLEGVIETNAEGALRPETVDPSSQKGMTAEEMDTLRQAIKDGWRVPEHLKQKYQEDLRSIILDEDVYLDKDGVEVRVRASPKTRISAIRLASLLDQMQYERDHPEEAGKAKGNSTTINNVNSVAMQMNIAAAAVIKEKLERGELDGVEGVGSTVPSSKPAGLSGGGLWGTMDSSSSSGGDEQRSSEGSTDAKQPGSG